MIERVALAICEEGGCGGFIQSDRVLCDDPRIPEEVRQDGCTCRNEARAAIAAMREPTEMMRRVDVQGDNCEFFATIYQAMIDEALGA